MPPISPEVLAMIQPGKKVRHLRGPDRSVSRIRHIRAIVDDEWVVYRVWQRGHWEYFVEWLYGFELAWQDGRLVKA